MPFSNLRSLELYYNRKPAKFVSEGQPDSEYRNLKNWDVSIFKNLISKAGKQFDAFSDLICQVLFVVCALHGQSEKGCETCDVI